MSQKFNPGRIVATPGALDAIKEASRDAGTYLTRHLSGDWGQLDAHDLAANDSALTDGSRLLSAYILPSGVKIWIITEADRSATTVLLPSEY